MAWQSDCFWARLKRGHFLWANAAESGAQLGRKAQVRYQSPSAPSASSASAVNYLPNHMGRARQPEIKV